MKVCQIDATIKSIANIDFYKIQTLTVKKNKQIEYLINSDPASFGVTNFENWFGYRTIKQFQN